MISTVKFYLVILMAMLIGSGLFAQMPTMPQILNHQISYSVDGYVLDLQFQSDIDYALTDQFNVYLAQGNTEDDGNFTVSSTLTRDGDETTIYDVSYTFTQVGDYSLYITGQNIIGEGEKSVYVHFFAGPQIIFSSTPGETEMNATIGQLYQYDAEAYSTDGSSVSFTLDDYPTGMNINSSSGIISWTPILKGEYSVNIIAHNNDYSFVNANQSYPLIVKSCTGKSFIGGTVLNPKNLPVANANIRIKIISSLVSVTEYNLSTDSQGKFNQELYEGVYQVYISGENFDAVWYPNAVTEDKAEYIVIECGMNRNITINVDPSEIHSISGNIWEKSTNYPIYPGMIEFYAFKDNRLTNVLQTQTHQDGSYSMELSDAFNYRIKAYSNTPGNRFLTQYFDNSFGFLEADELEIKSKDTTGINFYLYEPPAFVNFINGQVKNIAGQGIKSLVILYRHMQAEGYRTVETDNDGKFTFKNIDPDFYIIRCIPETGYSAGYYNSTDYIVNYWLNATRIDIKADSKYNNYFLISPPLISATGDGSIRGTISADLSSLKKSGDEVQADTALQAAVVYLLNDQGEAVDFMATGIDGKYSFNNISLGHYNIYVDKIAYDNFKSVDIYVSEIDMNKIVDISLQPSSHSNPLVQFKSTPLLTAKIDQLYSYDAEAIANNNGEVNFKLLSSPVSMSLDEQSGLINWNPEGSGTFSVSLEAYLKVSPDIKAQQDWEIIVSQENSLANIQGDVKDVDGTFYPNATLKLYDIINSATYTFVTDTEGKFSVNISAGEYKLNVSGPEFIETWYDNKTSYDDADIIEIQKGLNLTINVLVQPKIKKFKISGKITNSGSAGGLDNARVALLVYNDETENTFIATSSDLSGYYEFIVPENTKFKLFAAKEGEFAGKFYDDITDFAKTSLLTADKSMTDMDFALEQLPKTTVEISGMILDENNNPQPAIVTAFSLNGPVYEYSSYEAKAENSTLTNSGIYTVNVPISLNYIIKAFPLGNEYYPVYFSEELGASKFYWAESTTISIQDPSPVENKIFSLKKMKTISGNGTINGTISSEHNMDFSGFTVFAFDENRNVSKYSYTGNDKSSGVFKLENLALQKWNLIFDKIGYQSYIDTIMYVELKESQPDVTINLHFTGVEDNATNAQVDIYPNPAGNVININLYEEQLFTINFIIYDNLGNEKQITSSNDAKVKLDISGFSAGIYYLRITSNKGIQTIPFVKMN